MTHLLQRRLLAELFFNFFLGAGVLCALILIGRMVQLRELLLTLELTPWQLARLFGYLLPFFPAADPAHRIHGERVSDLSPSLHGSGDAGP